MDKPQLIASDVDGTLLTTAENVSPRTVDLVRRVTTAGVPFVLVTGRPPRWIPPVAGPAGLSGYAVCANGAVLYDIGEDRVEQVHGMDPMLLHDVAAALDEALPGCRLSAERVGRRAIDPSVQQFVIEPEYHNPWGDGESVTAPRAEIIGHPAVKLLVSKSGMTSDEMAEAARTALGGLVDITFSTGGSPVGGLIEIAAPGITKASGLAEVADRLGVSAERTIAFGDMPNDLAMLRWAGHGVAMANAHPAVLEVADEVAAPNSEDGVAQLLERWWPA